MNTVMSQEELEELLDSAVRTATRESAGVQLFHSGDVLGEDVCTVHITFTRGVYTRLALCADTALLSRMAHNIFGDDFNDREDLEDFSKEYFNVLCGKVSAYLKKTAQIATRFGVPEFYRGQYVPEDHQIQFVLTYSDDRREGAKLAHYVPRE